ncbi:lipopolysaccharide-binding protein-like [Ochotona princeps]|uniref:lipopolysaccharide-binding protein-like n=1 Tax=Ochotona princeps TaxID=9978 RepID=UPI0027154978|nr:lipopolysaccharide-binding protein-like [Ochotona princeps]
MMARLYPVIVVLWLLAGVSRFGEGTSNPGFVARVSRKGLEYACQYGVTILNKQLSNLRLPDFLGSYKAGWFGSVSYELHRLKIHHFRLGDSGLDLLPEHDVGVSLSNNFLQAGGSWKVEKEFITLKGTFDLRMDISISASLSLGKDQAGRPTASVAQCSNSIGHVSIDISGSLSWIFNLFHEKIEHGIKSLLEQEVCKEIRKLAGSYLEPYLRTLPVTTVIDQFAGIDYSLVGAPQVTAEGLDTSFKGEFFSLRQRIPVPFVAPAIRLPQRHDHMFYFAMSQYMFNTASHVYQKAGRTRIIIQNNQVTNLTNLTSQSARKWWKQNLNLSCLISNSTSLTAMVSCLSSNFLRLLLQVPTDSPISLQTNLLQRLFPPLARLFPDMEVEFEASPESQPLLTFTPGNVTFMPVMDIRISALQSNSSARRPLLHLMAKANISATISVRSGRIFGSVASGSNLKLELKHSSVSYCCVKLIEVIINHFVFKVVLPSLNAKLQEGFSLPLPNNTFISSLELQIHKNFLLLAANIN